VVIVKSIAVTQFKARCLSLLDEVARSGQPLEVTKHGKPLARIVPTAAANAIYPQDTLAGTVRILGDVVGPVVPQSRWSARGGVLLPQGATQKRRERDRR
jgi:prevent-host-death family protein